LPGSTARQSHRSFPRKPGCSPCRHKSACKEDDGHADVWSTVRRYSLEDRCAESRLDETAEQERRHAEGDGLFSADEGGQPDCTESEADHVGSKERDECEADAVAVPAAFGQITGQCSNNR